MQAQKTKNLVQILNSTPEGVITSVSGQGAIPSMIEITVDIYPVSARRLSDGKLTTLVVTMEEHDLLLCPALLTQIKSVYDTKDGDYLIRVMSLTHTFARSTSRGVSISGFLQLVSKAIFFTTGNTVIFEIEDYPKELKSKVGPLFTTITPFQVPTLSEVTVDSNPKLMYTQLSKSTKWNIEVDYDNGIATTARGKLTSVTARKYADIGWNVSLGIRYFASLTEGIPNHHAQTDFQSKAVRLEVGTSDNVAGHDFIEGTIYKTIVYIEVWDSQTDETKDLFIVNLDGSIVPAPFPWLPTV